MGLTEQWVEQVARIADEKQVVIVIDSLDVLSIAREHKVLSYFLAQIDRLLLIPRVTVLTSCRDFDRHYDHRIAVRQWECEITCQLLSWELEIVPVLIAIGINTDSIDTNTRELIKIPRELSLFVDLAVQEGSFNVVTSEALVQRYINHIVRDNTNLGIEAMDSIESIADAMLRSRSLSVPLQQFSASNGVYRELRSLNVLQETQGGSITFGHQTLLDALVINRAVRDGISLKKFIDLLTPVPFVRPSIRSYVTHLANSNRSDLRKEVRLVITSDSAFHIRRLVAESFAEQDPIDDDWPLIRELYINYREVFNIIYSHAISLKWHEFWLKHYIQVLRYEQNDNGLIAHAHKISIWLNDDPNGVVSFWQDVSFIDSEKAYNLHVQLGIYLSEINEESLEIVKPLLEKLLDLPRKEHNFLGHILAKCIESDVLDDSWLWRYISRDVSEEDSSIFQIENKLHCLSHEFGDDNNDFLKQRMIKSTKLLDLAIDSIEQWSVARLIAYGSDHKGYRHGFLDETSYIDVRTQGEHIHTDKLRTLLDKVQDAILNHAKNHTAWWKNNREQLCYSKEGALIYFAVIACTRKPHENIKLIEWMLSNKELLKFDLAYELSLLIKSSFIYFTNAQIDHIVDNITNIGRQRKKVDHIAWITEKKVKMLSAFPCYMRTPEVNELIEQYKNDIDIIDPKPDARITGGTVSAPFSFEQFIISSDSNVIKLLKHYEGFEKEYDDYLIGGKDEVGWQLREAASRQPSRFLKLLSRRWEHIDVFFRNNIMDGVANHLSYRFGNLQADKKWKPVDEDDGNSLANDILDELERHPNHWEKNSYSTSNAILACAHVIDKNEQTMRLVFYSIKYSQHRENYEADEEENNLLSAGINMTSGRIAEALMIIVNKYVENEFKLPELLLPTIIAFAGHENPAVRAVILSHLPYLIYKNQKIGWMIFERAMRENKRLWKIAERCLYYSYRNNLDKVTYELERLKIEGDETDMVIFGRIFSLAALTNLINFDTWLKELKEQNNRDAWRGAASVWTHTGNIQSYRDKCFAGLEAGLELGNPNAILIAHKMERIFLDNTVTINIPNNLINLCFKVLEADNNDKKERFMWFSKWLLEIAHFDPQKALFATERYLDYVKQKNIYIYDHRNHYGKLLTRLFAESEEIEAIDGGKMLSRVVVIQDILLSLGVDSVNSWLKAAERP